MVFIIFCIRCIPHVTYDMFFSQERLDFSCAMFSPAGDLVANGPHVPMHLGSMQETVKYQVHYIINYSIRTECSSIWSVIIC